MKSGLRVSKKCSIAKNFEKIANLTKVHTTYLTEIGRHKLYSIVGTAGEEYCTEEGLNDFPAAGHTLQDLPIA